jgi:hypothetical protein
LQTARHRRRAKARAPWRLATLPFAEEPSERRIPYARTEGLVMNNIVYIVGAVVIVLFILGFLGFR